MRRVKKLTSGLCFDLVFWPGPETPFSSALWILLLMYSFLYDWAVRMTESSTRMNYIDDSVPCSPRCTGDLNVVELQRVKLVTI